MAVQAEPLLASVLEDLAVVGERAPHGGLAPRLEASAANGVGPLEGSSMKTLHIQVELAVGWPGNRWTDGHYVYVPEGAGDPVAVAIERLAAELNAAGTECAFITRYSVEENARFTEDGQLIEGVGAEAHSDDRASEVSFDAAPYFEQASDGDLTKLAACGWGGDYPADEVAMFMADRNNQLADLFKYVEIARRVKDIGFECHVEAEEAMAWIETNRPELAVEIRKSSDRE
jgi:hypothetical protein